MGTNLPTTLSVLLKPSALWFHSFFQKVVWFVVGCGEGAKESSLHPFQPNSWWVYQPCSVIPSHPPSRGNPKGLADMAGIDFSLLADRHTRPALRQKWMQGNTFKGNTNGKGHDALWFMWPTEPQTNMTLNFPDSCLSLMVTVHYLIMHSNIPFYPTHLEWNNFLIWH